MAQLTANVARGIIEKVGSSGVPPEYGFQFFTAGLKPYLSVIEDEYLATYIQEGGAAFKMVVGAYGGGKTHFLYCVRDLAWKHGLAVSYVSLSPKECPFHQMELVYKAIALGIIPPMAPEQLLSGFEKDIASFLRCWYGQKYAAYSSQGLADDAVRDALVTDIEQIDGIESISFGKAIKAALHALIDKQDEQFDSVCQWLKGEGYTAKIHHPFGILEKIDKTTAPKMIRSLVQCVRQMGFHGLVILFDEAERKASLATKQTEQHLTNLRELIDACSRTSFQRVMIFYAVPDENFLEGKTNIYEALKQRVSTVLADFNPTGVKIELEKVVQDHLQFLQEVGNSLAHVYEMAYGVTLEQTLLEDLITQVANNAYTDRFLDVGYKRLFVKRLVAGLHFLRARGTIMDPLELAKIT